MNRIRLVLVALLLVTTGAPVVRHDSAQAQDEEPSNSTDQPSYGEDLYYQETPSTEDPGSAPTEDGTVDGSSDGSGETDLSWLPHTPAQPLDFSPFADALSRITPQRMAELEAMIVEANITQLEALMEAGKLTSQELVLFYVDRIQKYDAGQLNAVSQLNPDALYLAHLRDIQRKNGEIRGPLQGIPVLLKENIATGDSEATTAGALALAGEPAQHDAYLVRQLRDAGAVILGKTNMTEWANWMHMSYANGYSAFGGLTISPFGDDPSGSSTGNAVAITANFAPLAIGTETIGSIISPSARASIVGMHPTTGLVSNENIIPLSPVLDSAGPMGKTVTDIAVAMTVFAQSLDAADARSPQATPVAGVDFMAALDPNALQGAVIGVVPFDASLSDEETLAIFNATGAIDGLEAAGAQVVVVHPPGMADVDWWQLIACGLRDGVDHYLQTNRLSDPGSLADIIAINNSDPERYMPFGQDRLDEAQACTSSTTDQAALINDAVSMARAYLDDLIGSNGVDALVTLDDTFTLEYGLTGYPAITVPRGAAGGYTPSGLTFVGPECSDVTLVGYAYAFEQTGPYRIVPDLVSNPPVEMLGTPEAVS